MVNGVSASAAPDMFKRSLTQPIAGWLIKAGYIVKINLQYVVHAVG
jgi:hypothetical protein